MQDIYNVHPLTMKNIRNGRITEKHENFSEYDFFSFRMFSDMRFFCPFVAALASVGRWGFCCGFFCNLWLTPVVVVVVVVLVLVLVVCGMNKICGCTCRSRVQKVAGSFRYTTPYFMLMFARSVITIHQKSVCGWKQAIHRVLGDVRPGSLLPFFATPLMRGALLIFEAPSAL